MHCRGWSTLWSGLWLAICDAIWQNWFAIRVLALLRPILSMNRFNYFPASIYHLDLPSCLTHTHHTILCATSSDVPGSFSQTRYCFGPSARGFCSAFSDFFRLRLLQVLSIVFMASNFLSGVLCVKACYKNKARSDVRCFVGVDGYLKTEDHQRWSQMGIQSDMGISASPWAPGCRWTGATGSSWGPQHVGNSMVFFSDFLDH